MRACDSITQRSFKRGIHDSRRGAAVVTLLASQHRSVSDPPGAGCCAIADAYHTAVALWARSGWRMDAGEGFCTSSLGRCYDSVVMLLHQGQHRLPLLGWQILAGAFSTPAGGQKRGPYILTFCPCEGFPKSRSRKSACRPPLCTPTLPALLTLAHLSRPPQLPPVPPLILASQYKLDTRYCPGPDGDAPVANRIRRGQ